MGSEIMRTDQERLNATTTPLPEADQIHLPRAGWDYMISKLSRLMLRALQHSTKHALEDSIEFALRIKTDLF